MSAAVLRDAVRLWARMGQIARPQIRSKEETLRGAAMSSPRRGAERCLALAIPAGLAFEDCVSRQPWFIAGGLRQGLARGKMVNGAIKSHHAMLFAVQLALTLALFSLDISLGPGIADGIGYSIVMVLCLRNPKRGYA